MMDTIPDVIERISRNIEAKGVSPDREKVATKLNLLVEEFGIPLGEAERTVTNEMMRELGLGTGRPAASASDEPKRIADLASGEWVTIEGKVVSLSEPPSPAIAQSGIIADSSGAIRFVIWAKNNPALLDERQWFRIESAVVDDYRGAPNLKIHSGSKVTALDDERPLMPSIVPIAELKPGVGSVRAKVIQDWELRHDRMLQKGLLGDESGTIPFVIWKDEGKEKLTADGVYTVYYALVDEYMGSLSLNLTTAMYLPEEGDIEVASRGTGFSGAFIHISPGSGLIKRCPVEGCNRVLQQRNYCPVHEIQSDFRWDLRIKGVVDDGIKARNVLLQREATEAITGMKLEKAREMAENNPLGLDDVLIQMSSRILGRYVHCTGSDIDGTILVKECKLPGFSAEKHAELINRAAAAEEGDAE
jgi:replication factor A1